MKKILMQMSVLTAFMCAVACQDKFGEEKGVAPNYIDYSDGQIELILTDSRTVEADGDGVSISIKNVENANVTFECRPGANVQSYRLDVIPLSMIYNTIINEYPKGADQEQVEDIIIRILANSSSTNGVVFSEDTFDDYYSHTFDWMNTEYHNGNILCDCDYVICVAPCFDKEGFETSSVNLAYFKTGAPALVGRPTVRIDVSASYRSFQAVHEPNDDCKYICYWSYLTDNIDEYLDMVGRRMLRDFIRCASQTYNVANASDLVYHVDFGQSADADVSHSCLAVAHDVNGTPEEGVTSRIVELKPIPESPAAAYTIRPHRAAASIFWLSIDFEPTCRNCYYRWLSVDEAAKIKAYSEDQKTAYARDLYETGWGVHNPDFHFNIDTNRPTGDSNSVIEHQVVAYKPLEQYVIVSAGENYYGEITALQFSDPVVMKPRVTDRPHDCLVKDDEFACVLDNASRTGFKYNFSYSNPEEIALHYFQIVSPVDAEARETNPEMCPPENIETATHAEWMRFFFETYVEAADGEKVLQVNAWDAEAQGYDGLAMFGYEPGTEYVVAYCVEDTCGVISNVRFERITTNSINVGDNPKAAITANLADGEWTFTFTANEDTGTLLYMTSSYGDANYQVLALPFLLKDAYDDYPYYSSFYDLWDEKIMSLGLTTNSLTTYATEAAPSDGSVVLALCLPVGADKDGKPVYGELQHLLIVDNQVKHLEDYREKK